MVIVLFLIAFLLRVLTLLPANTVIGFDQARDLWDATTIFRDGNLRIIGPTAGNNLNLHHGIAFLYYMIPPLLAFGGNPIGVTLWNSLFNAGLVVIVYLFAKSLFNKRMPAFIAAILTAFSFQFVQFSGWISNPTATLMTVPVFFWGLWEYYKGKKWGLPLAAAFLGLSIQFELFFLYLIPVFFIYWILLRPKLPELKLAILSLGLLTVTLSTMIATEIKFRFAGVLSLLGAGQKVGGGEASFLEHLIMYIKRWEDFPGGVIIGVICILFILFEAYKTKKKEARKRNMFLLLFFFSPAIMLLLGYHNAPWFLIGRPLAAVLIVSFVISRLRFRLLIVALLVFQNLTLLSNASGRGQVLLDPDPAALMQDQLAAVDYTYQSSAGAPFVINTVTNPLYINAVWSYHYNWYGKQKYGALPSWGGGDQEYPYNILPKQDPGSRIVYLIIDTTPRIPEVHKILARQWADKYGTLIETKHFGGVLVEKRVKE